MINIPESLTVEFKREYTEELKKTIAAFANTKGGTLYIGIADDGSVVGVDNPDETMRKIIDSVRNGIKPDVTLFVGYKTEIMEGTGVIVVTVQQGTAAPYYLVNKGLKPEGVYVRQGASSVPASEAAILKMIKETDGERYEEVRSLNQDLTFKEAEKFFAEKGFSLGVNQMKTLHLMTPDGVYTNLGLLLSDQTINTVKLAVFEGGEKEIFKDRREFSGSLLKQLRDAYDFIDMYNHTHAEVTGLYRTDTRDYPEDAIREALLNAMVHRDYGFAGSTLISIFYDRIDFVSIGGLPKGISLEDIMLGISVPRNENLANIFYRLKLIEAYGTGIPKILHSYADFPGQPLLQTTGNAFKITLPNRNTTGIAARPNRAVHSQIDNRAFPSIVAEHTPPYGVRYGPQQPYSASSRPLTEGEEKALALFDTRQVVVRKDLEAALSVSQAMAVRLLRGLLDKGAIRSVGGGKNTRYTR
ncbi:MAG: putative DNA binding domain-containing protein [Treponema sp.]|jgi:ATP-dependent DNA helicase RecG|nr:putative DNA binding domain-containing protein [Treponema sp.]